MARFRACAAAAAVVLAAGACATEDGGGPRFGPGYIEVGENRRFSVSYLPELDAALLNFSIIRSFDAEGVPPEPPEEAEWRAAAEAAAAEQGCTLADLVQESEDTYRASFACPENGDGA